MTPQDKAYQAAIEAQAEGPVRGLIQAHEKAGRELQGLIDRKLAALERTPKPIARAAITAEIKILQHHQEQVTDMIQALRDTIRSHYAQAAMLAEIAEMHGIDLAYWRYFDLFTIHAMARQHSQGQYFTVPTKLKRYVTIKDDEGKTPRP